MSKLTTATGPTPSIYESGNSLLVNIRPYYPILAQLAAVLILVVLFTIQNPLFLSIENFQNIGRQSSVLLLVALAGTLVIMIGSIDLSVGATVTLTGLLTAICVDRFGALGGLAIGLGAGALVGVANGLLLVRFKVPSFLATLGMLSVLTGLSGHVSGGMSIMFNNVGFADFVNGAIGIGLPNVALIAIVVAMALSFVALRTKFGRYLYAIGGGEIVASNSGVPIDRYKVYAFVVCGALCGLAGALLAGQVGAGTPSAGSSLLLNSIAAIVMGGTALSGGVGGPHRTILGVLVIAILTNGMDVVEIGGFTQDIVKGAVIIVAVALTNDRKKYQFIK